MNRSALPFIVVIGFFAMAAAWLLGWLTSTLWPEQVYVFHGICALATVLLMMWMLRGAGLYGPQDPSGSSTTAVP